MDQKRRRGVCNALVPLIPKGARQCKLPPIEKVTISTTQRPFLQHQVDRANLTFVKRIAMAMRGGRVPGPCEAKLIMDDIRLCRLTTRKRRLTQEELRLHEIKNENDRLMDRIGRVNKEGGIVDTYWDSDFIRLWSKVQCELRQRRFDERMRKLRDIEEGECLVRRLKGERGSEYSREIVEKDWPWKVAHMYKDASHPCSPWWHEYLHCVAGERPRRLAPPYPAENCECFLEGFERKNRRTVDKHLRTTIGNGPYKLRPASVASDDEHLSAYGSPRQPDGAAETRAKSESPHEDLITTTPDATSTTYAANTVTSEGEEATPATSPESPEESAAAETSDGREGEEHSGHSDGHEEGESDSPHGSSDAPA